MKDDRRATTFSRRTALRLGLGTVMTGVMSSPNWAQPCTTRTIQSRRKPVAAVVTIYRPNSHADVILTKILQGWKHDGGPGPELQLASIYIDQPEGSEFGIELCKAHGVPICATIEEALTRGGGSIAVDGVLSIGEHGDYPVNSIGQQLYPRKRFFQEITAAFEKFGRVVPVFNDKHISTVWEEAKWMYDRSVEMKIPFMSGSSLPVTYRSVELDVPLGSEIESAVGIGYSGLDIYGFHALECYQSIVERRQGAESGVEWVRCLEGEDVWKGLDSEWVTEDLIDAAYQVIPKSKSRAADDPNPVLFQFQYCDGFRGTLLMLSSASLTGIALRLHGRQVMATGFEERPEPRYPHFAYLLKGIESMVHTGRSPYPVERTLLTGGLLDRALHSRAEGGRRLTTPELHIQYQPVDYRYAPHIDLEAQAIAR